MFLKLFLFFICFNYIFSISVKTTSGVVKGTTIEILKQNIEEYLGIPYAEPPIGKLRFARPKPIHLLNGNIVANQTKHSCIQSKENELGQSDLSEDCLQLNIWSSKLEGALKPVMFWIHGGALSSGTTFMPIYSGSILATHEVVVVSANYRLGALGFLYGGEESSPGNLGFYDQLLALKWVRENIHLFGGDKNKITIFGESAGSWSVSAHLISPLSKDLFKRAIMQSGALMFNKNRPLFVKEEGLILAKKFAKRKNCSDDNQWLDCLRNLKSNYFISNGWDIFFPTYGTEFLPFYATKAFSEHKFNKDLDLLAGVTKDEGSILLNYIIPEWEKKETFEEKDFIYFFNKINKLFHDLDLEIATKYYLNNVNRSDSNAIKWKIYDFLGQICISCPTYLFAKRYSEHSVMKNVFFYELTHSLAERDDLGVFHSADLEFVFGTPLLKPNNISKKNIDFIKQVMKYWTDFAKYGHLDKNWTQFIDTKTNSSVIKELNPNNPNHYFHSLFGGVCDKFSSYFIGAGNFKPKAHVLPMDDPWPWDGLWMARGPWKARVPFKALRPLIDPPLKALGTIMDPPLKALGTIMDRPLKAFRPIMDRQLKALGPSIHFGYMP